jgi:ribose transport system substrate-binding protein
MATENSGGQSNELQLTATRQRAMKRILILIAISLFLCSTASAFQGGGGESTKNPKPTTKPKPASVPKPRVEPNRRSSTPIPGANVTKRLAFVTNNASDFWFLARKGTEKADRELSDVSVEFRITPNGTAAEQKRIVDDLVAEGIDGIAISPVDPTIQTPFINETAKQTLVFTQDSDAPQSDRTAFLGADNVAAGRQAGALIKEALPDGGKIMVFVGNRDARNAQERFQGIQEALRGSSVEVIDVRTDGADRERAKSNVADTLVRFPDIKGLVGLWSYNGPAILEAVTEAGKLNEVKIISFDDLDETLAGVKAGTIFATVVQQPFEFGYQTIKMMAQVLRGNRSGIPASKRVIVPTLIIKKESVEEFRRKIQEQSRH